MEKNSKRPNYKFQPPLEFEWGSLYISKEVSKDIPVKPPAKMREIVPNIDSTITTDIFVVSQYELFSMHKRAPELFEYHKDDNSLFHLLFSRSKLKRQLFVAMRPDCVEKIKAMGREDFANYTDFMDNPIVTKVDTTADMSVEEIIEAGLSEEFLVHLISFISQVIEDSIIQEYIQYDKNNLYRRLRRVLGFMAAGDIQLYAFASIVEHGNDSLGKALFFGNVGFLSALKNYIGDSENARLTRQEIETNARNYALTIARQIYDEFIS